MMKHLPLIYSHIKDETFCGKILIIVLDLTQDKVSKVREATATLLSILIQEMGGKWFQKNVSDCLIRLKCSVDYHHRILLLKIIDVTICHGLDRK